MKSKDMTTDYQHLSNKNTSVTSYEKDITINKQPWDQLG